MGFLSEGYLLGNFWKISLGPFFALFQKMRVWVTWRKLPWLGHSGTSGAALCAKILSSLCTSSAYWLEDNAICASVLLGLFREGIFLGDFWKISLGTPFALFQKMRVLGDLAKIAIPWPFGHFWSRCFPQNLLQSLQFKSESMGAPGRPATRYLSDFDETWPV